MRTEVLEMVCPKGDRRAALDAFVRGAEPPINSRGFYLGMKSLAEKKFLPVQTGQPSTYHRDNYHLRRAIRLWKALYGLTILDPAEVTTLETLIKLGEKCDVFLRCRAAAPGTYCSVDPNLPGLMYIGKTDNRCTDRGAQARKVVRLAATSSDSRTPRELEVWTQDGFEPVKIGKETWFKGGVEEVEQKWEQAPEMWYVRCSW